jgi:cyclic-di-AMP phosphodiesterase PgpH
VGYVRILRYFSKEGMKRETNEEDFSQKEGKGFALKEKLRKQSLGWRLLVSFICVLFLAFFMHFRETRIEVLEFQATAPKFIVNQIDFEFPDEEATVILKQEALSEIGDIYRISEREIHEARFEFENFLIQNRNWKSEVPTSTFEELYKSADALEEAMVLARFTDSKTLQKISEYQLPTNRYLSYLPQRIEDPAILPASLWNAVSEQAISEENFSPAAMGYVVDFFKTRKWVMEEDFNTKRLLRQLVEKGIPEKYTKVRAGTRIIDQGERVSSRHIAMMKAMKDALNEHRKLWAPLPMASSLLFSIIFVLVSALYFRINQPEMVRSLQKLSLLVTIVLLTLIFAKATEYFLLHSSASLMDSMRYPLIIPFSTILICVLLNGRIALYTSTFLAIILSVTLAVDHSRFLIINIVTSFAIIISIGSLRKRKEVFYVSAKAFLSAVPILFAFQFASNHFWSISLFHDLVCCFLFLAMSAILVVGLLPLLETIFRVMTEMTLMEFMDPNNELLRRMTLEIPGTYQHSLVLGNLAESMARAIGADGLFCRVATLYHDVGKLNNPHFFTENQQGGVNIHQLLTPMESAQVIIAHVKEGEILARKYRLPEPFIDIIKEHHGTTLVYYFYCKEVELKGGNASQVEESQFRYLGPKPHTKESAIIMIADTIEAASRSLENANEKTLTDLVNRLVKDRSEDGQFDECLLTFEELGIVKRALVKTLLLTHHIRIKYPEKARS